MNFSPEIIPLCPEKHPLIWKQSYMSKPCDQCKTTTFGYSRWSCQTCQTIYCVGCIKPLSFNLKCPLNHSLVSKELFSNTCDCCRKHIKGMGYRDATCDFDLCQKCMYEIEKED